MFALKQRLLITFTALAAASGGESDGERVVVGCEEDEEVLPAAVDPDRPS